MSAEEEEAPEEETRPPTAGGTATAFVDRQTGISPESGKRKWVLQPEEEVP